MNSAWDSRVSRGYGSPSKALSKIKPLQDVFTVAHSERQHRLLLCAWIGWVLVWAIYFALKYNEGNITGDLVHQITTALDRVAPATFSRDYLYRDPATMAFYSPQQIWSIAGLYRITGSIAWSLGVLQFLYSVVCVVGAWLLARELSRNVWVMAMTMAIVLQYVTVPLNIGQSWGFLRGPLPAYFPYNWLLARGLFLLFLACVVKNEGRSEAAQAAILGLIFTVHAPTGLTLTFGAAPYFLWRLQISRSRVVFFKWTAAFLAGASFFLVTYWLTAPRSATFTPAQSAFFYDFVQYRFPDDYPAPLWKLVLRSGQQWGWIAHAALVVVSAIGTWGLVTRRSSVLLGGTGILFAYVFGIKALPLAIFIIYFSYLARKELTAYESVAWRLALIAYGAFFVCTWAQWASDIYYATRRLPPVIVDNTRFLPFLFAFAAIMFASITARLRKQAWLLMVYGILAIPLGRPLFDGMYQSFADRHGIKWRSQFDFDPQFALSESDNRKVIEFAERTPASTVFLYESSSEDGWDFRLRARRSIAINSNDIGVKYYQKKGELLRDWPVYVDILQAYRERSTQHLCRAAAGVDFDYVVFPKATRDEPSCLSKVLSLNSGSVYSRRASDSPGTRFPIR